MTPGALGWIYAERGSPLHEHLCSAALDWGGFTLVAGELYSVLWAEPAETDDFFKWRVRPSGYFGEC